MAITQKQQRFLLERLDTARRSKPREYMESDDYKVPESVAKAQREIGRLQTIVREHESKRRKVRKLRDDKISDEYIVAKETILFGDEAKALSALKAFESKKF